MHDLGLKTSIQTFNAFVRCALMGNQPWCQFQNEIRERSILHRTDSDPISRLETVQSHFQTKGEN